MQRIEVLEITERHQDVTYADYVEFNTMVWNPMHSGWSEVIDPVPPHKHCGVSSYREPIHVECTQGPTGIEKRFFVIGPELRKALGWNLNMKEMEAQRNSAKIELTQIKDRNAKLNKWNDRLHAMLKNCQEELHEFKSMPWYLRVLSAIRNDRVVHHD